MRHQCISKERWEGLSDIRKSCAAKTSPAATSSPSPLRDAEPGQSRRRLSFGYALSQRPVTSGRIRLLHSAELFLPIFPIERGCPMLIPLGHENMEGRRWPVISIALVLLNVGIFLATRGQLHQENPQRTEVRAHLLLLAAQHPELSLPPNVEALVIKCKSTNPGTWKEAQSETRDLAVFPLSSPKVYSGKQGEFGTRSEAEASLCSPKAQSCS